MNILDQIIASKKKEVALKKTIVPIADLENQALFQSKTLSLSNSIANNAFGIIAEHKRRSPSKPDINSRLSVEKVVTGYQQAGAAAISVLTDGQFFGGSLEDLLLTKACVQIPVLRKEFILEEYQIIEAKAHGADAILLIASVLNTDEIKRLTNFAQTLELEILIEVHNEVELEKAMHAEADLIGVNNRDLQSFEIRLENSIRLSSLIPDSVCKISESGITAAHDIQLLKKHGFQGFLIGERFMKEPDPGSSLKQFINELR